MNVLVLAAAGQIASFLIPELLDKTDNQLTLFARDGSKRLLGYRDDSRVTFVDGNLKSEHDLTRALTGQDIVVLATMPDPVMAQSVVNAMEQSKCKRLIVTGGFGIFREVPGAWGELNARLAGGYDGPNYQSTMMGAQIIDDSDLNTTYIRMTWLYDNDTNLSYEIIPKGQPMPGTQITREAVADFVTKLVNEPNLYENSNIGIQEPNTNWDQPSFFK